MNVSVPVRVTRKLPASGVTSAIPPVVANGELAAIVTPTPAELTVPLTVGSALPGIELAELPLQPGSMTTPAVAATVDASRLQNSRRL
jgi:hypothetical protein